MKPHTILRKGRSAMSGTQVNEMNWLRRFMYGRYGQDEFSIALVALTLLLSMICVFIPVYWVRLISMVPFGYYIFRTLSRNITARRKENRWFLGWFRPIVRWFQDKIKMLRQRKTHRFFKCKGCGQVLRVPKGRGKLEITCPRCKNRMIRKT